MTKHFNLISAVINAAAARLIKPAPPGPELPLFVAQRTNQRRNEERLILRSMGKRQYKRMLMRSRGLRA